MSASTTVVLGHEVLSIVARAGGRCATEDLRALSAARFGEDAVYGNCHGELFSFDDLLEFFAQKGKLVVSAGVVSLGGVPGCSGH
jgi:probable metal-binding protein